MSMDSLLVSMQMLMHQRRPATCERTFGLAPVLSRRRPFDVCQKAWNDLLALGFTSRYMKCNMTCVYADCCLEMEQDEAGLAVVEPVIAELEDWLAVTTLEPNGRSDYESGLAGLKKRRDKLKAAIDKS